MNRIAVREKRGSGRVVGYTEVMLETTQRGGHLDVLSGNRASEVVLHIYKNAVNQDLAIRLMQLLNRIRRLTYEQD
jgi:hypothetical protein